MIKREDIEANATAMLFELAGLPEDDRESPTAMLDRRIAEYEEEGYMAAVAAWSGVREKHQGISVGEFRTLTRNVLAALARP